ncbi:hypothetical protein SSS_09032 [Sarcoptes scabiei]|uniref:Uncharacterized protein n=1 Tax=Sarcoptes scabiei TaxID=52283 RepID=A0A834R2I0_SARSC|nr:hypothetical protein SSS_09032 [Sarcoptes scabiei]
MRTPNTLPNLSRKKNNKNATSLQQPLATTHLMSTSVISTSPSSTTPTNVSSKLFQTSHENIFGRIKKVCSGKTKTPATPTVVTASASKHLAESSKNNQIHSTVASTPSTNTSNVQNNYSSLSDCTSTSVSASTTTVSTQTHSMTADPTFRFVDSSPTPKNEFVNDHSLYRSSANPIIPIAGPIITGAVTKHPSTGLSCSPSKQLLNSMFTNYVNSKNFQSISHHSEPNSSNDFYAIHDRATIALPKTPPTISHRKVHSNSDNYCATKSEISKESYMHSPCGSNKLKQSTSHDSLLNLNTERTSSLTDKNVSEHPVYNNHRKLFRDSTGSPNSNRSTHDILIVNNPIQAKIVNKNDITALECDQHSFNLNNIRNASNSSSPTSKSSSPSSKFPNQSNSIGSLRRQSSAVDFTSVGQYCKRCCAHLPMETMMSINRAETLTVPIPNTKSIMQNLIRTNVNNDTKKEDMKSGQKSSTLESSSLPSTSASTIPNILFQTATNKVNNLASANLVKTSPLMIENINLFQNYLSQNLNDNCMITAKNKLYNKPFSSLINMRRSISKDSIDNHTETKCCNNEKIYL